MKVCPRCYQISDRFEYPHGGASAYCVDCSRKISRRLPHKVVVVMIGDIEAPKPRLGMFGQALRAKLDFLKKKGCSVYAQMLGTDDLWEWRTFRKQPVSRNMLRRHMIDKEKVGWVDVWRDRGSMLNIVEVLGE
jgi:hypothetical protein